MRVSLDTQPTLDFFLRGWGAPKIIFTATEYLFKATQWLIVLGFLAFVSVKTDSKLVKALFFILSTCYAIFLHMLILSLIFYFLEKSCNLSKFINKHVNAVIFMSIIGVISFLWISVVSSEVRALIFTIMDAYLPVLNGGS